MYDYIIFYYFNIHLYIRWEKNKNTNINQLVKTMGKINQIIAGLIEELAIIKIKIQENKKVLDNNNYSKNKLIPQIFLWGINSRIFLEWKRLEILGHSWFYFQKFVQLEL